MNERASRPQRLRQACTHPPLARELHNGYDVTCGDCEAIVGRVATVDRDAVLNYAEAKEVLAMIGEHGEGTSVKAKLARIAR
jgi:hypothetical protein